MTRFVGLDVHKRFVEVCFLSEEGELLSRERIDTTREELLRFAEKALLPSDQVVLEATGNTWAVVELLEPFVAKIAVSNPLRTRAIASAKVKTDRIDARVLAELLRCGYLPEVWQPNAKTRQQRSLLHYRAALRRDSTRFKNRIHAHLAQRLIVVPYDDLFCTKARAWLQELELDILGRAHLDSDLALLTTTEAELAKVDQNIAELAYPNEQLRLLLTLPGVDVTVAQGVLAAWGDPSRFPDADRAVSYLGLAPSTRQSGARCYHGPITKQGSSHVRWLLVQAAQHVDRHPGPLGVFFRRLAKKKGRNVAVVATARKLALVAWHMLKNNEPYRYAQPKTVQAKLSRLRVRATQERRKSGPAKGTPRTSAYGSGKQTRTTPALNDILASEDLPPATPPDLFPPGEHRMLASSKCDTFAIRVQKPLQRPRRTRAKTGLSKLTSS